MEAMGYREQATKARDERTTTEVLHERLVRLVDSINGQVARLANVADRMLGSYPRAPATPSMPGGVLNAPSSPGTINRITDQIERAERELSSLSEEITRVESL
jgi:hypothetical protein